MHTTVHWSSVVNGYSGYTLHAHSLETKLWHTGIQITGCRGSVMETYTEAAQAWWGED